MLLEQRMKKSGESIVSRRAVHNEKNGEEDEENGKVCRSVIGVIQRMIRKGK